MQKPKVVFLVNGEPASAMGIRARSFEQRLAPEFDIHVAYRCGNKLRSMLRFFQVLLRRRPDICYVLDFGFSGVLAGGAYRLLSRRRLIADTGDAIYELSRSSGTRG